MNDILRYKTFEAFSNRDTIKSIVDECLRDFCYLNLLGCNITYGKYFPYYNLFVSDKQLMDNGLSINKITRNSRYSVIGIGNKFSVGDFKLNGKRSKKYDYNNSFTIEIYSIKPFATNDDVDISKIDRNNDFKNCISHLHASLKRELNIISITNEYISIKVNYTRVIYE